MRRGRTGNATPDYYGGHRSPDEAPAADGGGWIIAYALPEADT
jgi:hypothetical protein